MILAVEKQRQEGNMSILNDLNNNWYKLAPIVYLYERDTPRSRNISTNLKQFYFGNQEIGPNTYDGLAHVCKLSNKNCHSTFIY